MEGLLSQILKGTPLANLGLHPTLVDRDLVIEINEDQFKQMILGNADARVRNSVDIKIEHGKIVIRIRLF